MATKKPMFGGKKAALFKKGGGKAPAKPKRGKKK